jgi:DNA repair protein RadA/Sms
MAKTRSTYVCQSCGSVLHRWSGKCPDCEEWNTIVEETEVETGTHVRLPIVDNAVPIPITSSDLEPPERLLTGMIETDRVLGGGIVPGSLMLLGGDPGIGKSTLMLQIAHSLASRYGTVLYVSGEESFDQTRLRAERLKAIHENVHLLTESSIDTIRTHIKKNDYACIVVDSIQSVYSSELSSVPGSVGQVRECANEFLRLSKGMNVPIFLVGHVTKDGTIAGPRVLEHLVDTVLYFEGEGKQALRILRGVKNRFGSTHEMGVFEMTDKGLLEVDNPSALFLQERPKETSGSVVMASMEGSRPVLVEIQALVTESHLASPRRTVTGMNQNRVSLILAVLEKRCGLGFSGMDVFVNVAGGARIDEPAADLALALALVSSLRDEHLSPSLSVVGEIGLAGELRTIDRLRQRVQEAMKFGLTTCILPELCKGDVDEIEGGKMHYTSTIEDAIEIAFN